MKFDSRTGKAALCRRGALTTNKYFAQLGYENLVNARRVHRLNCARRRIERLGEQVRETEALIAELSL